MQEMRRGGVVKTMFFYFSEKHCRSRIAEKQKHLTRSKVDNTGRQHLDATQRVLYTCRLAQETRHKGEQEEERSEEGWTDQTPENIQE